MGLRRIARALVSQHQYVRRVSRRTRTCDGVEVGGDAQPGCQVPTAAGGTLFFNAVKDTRGFQDIGGSEVS